MRRRRPPGVQERHITGEEFLARVVWARWVRKATEGIGSPPREEPTSPRGSPIHLICFISDFLFVFFHGRERSGVNNRAMDEYTRYLVGHIRYVKKGNEAHKICLHNSYDTVNKDTPIHFHRAKHAIVD